MLIDVHLLTQIRLLFIITIIITRVIMARTNFMSKITRGLQLKLTDRIIGTIYHTCSPHKGKLENDGRYYTLLQVQAPMLATGRWCHIFARSACYSIPISNSPLRTYHILVRFILYAIFQMYKHDI